MRVIRSKKFTKHARKLPTKIKLALASRLHIFMADPNHTILNNHSLGGELQEYRSINITGDFRLIFEQLNDDLVRLIDVDTHHNLYGS